MGWESITYLLNLKGIIIIASITLLLLIIIFILYSIERKLKKKLKSDKNRNNFYKNKIKGLNRLKSNPEQFLNAINNLTKDFFKEAFNLSDSLEYSELISEFRKLRKKECISFCNLMIETSYSGEKIENRKLSILSSLLEKIMDKNKIIPKEEGKEQEENNKEDKGIKEVKEEKIDLTKKPILKKEIIKEKIEKKKIRKEKRVKKKREKSEKRIQKKIKIERKVKKRQRGLKKEKKN